MFAALAYSPATLHKIYQFSCNFHNHHTNHTKAQHTTFETI